MRLRDKIALVTGAGSGIGRQTAIVFAAEGASVVIVDRSEADASATAELIKAEVGAEAQTLPVRTDVAREAEIAELVS